MDASSRSRWRALHRGAGALFGVVLFVVLFSGTWSLATDSMQGWWRPPPVAVARPALPLDALVARAAALGVALRDARIVLPQPDGPAIRFCGARQRCPLALQPGRQAPVRHQARLLLIQHFVAQTRHVQNSRNPANDAIQFMGAQSGQQAVAGVFVQCHGNPAAALLGPGNRLSQHAPLQKGNHTHMQVGRTLVGDGFDIQRPMIKIRQHGLRARQNQFAQRRGRHAPRRPLEQRRAKQALQFRQSLRHSRLTGGQLFSHPRERAILLDGQQQRQVLHPQARHHAPGKRRRRIGKRRRIRHGSST